MTRVIALLLLLAPALAAQAATVSVRVKDIVTYRNTAPNTLFGEGLVVGLKGTGDEKDKKTQEMLRAASAQLHHSKLPPSAFASKNVARVQVTVAVEAFKGGAGAPLSCRVSAVDNSKSLENGTLLMTELRYGLNSQDENVYGEAGGVLSLEFDNGKPRNPTNATVPGNLLRDIPVAFYESREDDYGNSVRTMTLLLKHPDSTTAMEITRAINESRAVLEQQPGLVSAGRNPRAARAINDGTVLIEIPPRWHGEEMAFKEIVDTTTVNPDTVAQVVVNQKTGVVAFNGNVRVLPGAFTVKGVSVTIAATGELPTRPAAGEEVTGATVPLAQPNTQLQQLIDTFNLLKLSADEKIAVIRALEQNGMLQAKVVYE